MLWRCVCHFRENGLKLLLSELGNLRDLFALLGLDLRERRDFPRLSIDPTTYIATDYWHRKPSFSPSPRGGGWGVISDV
jgi:hypothetical protein